MVDLSDVVDAAGNPLLQTTLRVELRDELQPTALIRATLENDMVLDAFEDVAIPAGAAWADAVSLAISGGTASIGPGLEVLNRSSSQLVLKLDVQPPISCGEAVEVLAAPARHLRRRGQRGGAGDAALGSRGAGIGAQGVVYSWGQNKYGLMLGVAM